MLREYEAPAEDARGRRHAVRAHERAVQMDNVVFQDIVLPHLTAGGGRSAPHVEFSGLRRQERRHVPARQVPQFRVRWLPGSLRSHQGEGVLPHCKMKSRDGLGRVTLVNAIYSERLVNIVVDFGSWIPR